MKLSPYFLLQNKLAVKPVRTVGKLLFFLFFSAASVAPGKTSDNPKKGCHYHGNRIKQLVCKILFTVNSIKHFQAFLILTRRYLHQAVLRWPRLLPGTGCCRE